MSDLCYPSTFSGLAQRLGFRATTAGGLVEFRNPFGLENWTLPVLEITVISRRGAGPGVRHRAAASAQLTPPTWCCGSAPSPTC